VDGDHRTDSNMMSAALSDFMSAGQLLLKVALHDLKAIDDVA